MLGIQTSSFSEWASKLKMVIHSGLQIVTWPLYWIASIGPTRLSSRTTAALKQLFCRGTILSTRLFGRIRCQWLVLTDILVQPHLPRLQNASSQMTLPCVRVTNLYWLKVRSFWMKKLKRPLLDIAFRTSNSLRRYTMSK